MAKKKVESTTKTKAVKPKATKSKASKATIEEVKDEAAILADIAVKGILEKKGKNITCLNLKGISNRVCDYFIICEGDSTTQVDAIARSVEDEVRKTTGEKPYHAEGFENSEWVLIDYVTVVVHVFQKEIREFYNLESLWADAEVQEFAFEY